MKLLVAMGYGGSIQDAGKAVGKTGDGGIDGIINEDKLGLDNVFIQAKRYSEQSIGSKIVRESIGSLTVHRARKGVLITTSTFTADAIWFERHRTKNGDRHDDDANHLSESLKDPLRWEAANISEVRQKTLEHGGGIPDSIGRRRLDQRVEWHRPRDTLVRGDVGGLKARGDV